MKNKTVKILGCLFATLTVLWLAYWMYQDLVINIKKPKESAILTVTIMFILFEFLAVWMFFGLDIIRGINKKD